MNLSKKRKKSLWFLGLRLISAILLTSILGPGCSIPKFNDHSSESEASSSETSLETSTDGSGFRSTAIAVPVATEAEVATDLAELGLKQETAEAIGYKLTPHSSSNNVTKTESHTATQASSNGTLSKKHGKKGKHSASTGKMSYSVQSGDTLMKISFKAFGDPFRWHEIYKANHGKIHNPNALSKGTLLTLATSEFAMITKNGHPYSIQRKDTLSKISHHLYGITSKWRKLWKNNPELIHNPNQIFAGFTLYYLK